ncbi:hypothetical protein XENTR_v10001679 [Xenopus tropicalis]|nr:hypothetical protein XENTR_v10001679 [Xenopus tropicalis]
MDLKLAKGESCVKKIWELAVLNKNMEEVESEIDIVLKKIEPWRETYSNKERFQQMHKGESAAQIDFASKGVQFSGNTMQKTFKRRNVVKIKWTGEKGRSSRFEARNRSAYFLINVNIKNVLCVKVWAMTVKNVTKRCFE